MIVPRLSPGLILAHWITWLFATRSILLNSFKFQAGLPHNTKV
jgi:hypothetical protein